MKPLSALALLGVRLTPSDGRLFRHARKIAHEAKAQKDTQRYFSAKRPPVAFNPQRDETPPPASAKLSLNYTSIFDL
jgi:hypothetical protein